MMKKEEEKKEKLSLTIQYTIDTMKFCVNLEVQKCL